MHYLDKSSTKLFLPLLFAVFLYSSAFGQTPDIDAIQAGSDHYWGEFCSTNQNESESAAIDQLLSKIAVNIESSFTNKVSESISDNQAEYKEEVEGIVKTYSSAQLKNLKTFKEPRDCGIYVFRYIEKASVNEIFENRKQLVKDIFDKAAEFEEEANYANALKYYYYSIVLLNSIPESTLMHNGENLYVEPGFRIPAIMQSVTFDVISDEMLTDNDREITLAVLVDGEKAETLDFSFWDGNNSVSAKSIDGTATINLYGSSTMLREIQINVKYDYYENRGEIKEVSDLWNLVQRPPFNYPKRIRLDEPVSKEKKEELTKKVAFEPMNESFTLNTFMEDSNPEETNNEAEAVDEEQLKVLVPQHLEGLQDYFNEGVTNAEWEKDDFLKAKLSGIEDFNNLSVSNNSSKSEINKTRDGWEFRQLTTTARYPSINLQTKEYLVPDLDSVGVVKDVNFGVMDGMYEEFRRQAGYGKDWDKRQVMIKFVEKYRTAYLTRNVDQLGTMFAEQAVIITGRVLKVDNSSSGDKFAYEQNQERQPNVEYLRETKKEFLERQSLLFASKPDIHLGFSTFNILRKNNQEGIYGISMRQSYQSTNYSDEGYLFLLIDFNSEQPKIYVRAWQPKEWSDEALVELGNFKVNN